MYRASSLVSRVQARLTSWSEGRGEPSMILLLYPCAARNLQTQALPCHAARTIRGRKIQAQGEARKHHEDLQSPKPCMLSGKGTCGPQMLSSRLFIATNLRRGLKWKKTSANSECSLGLMLTPHDWLCAGIVTRMTSVSCTCFFPPSLSASPKLVRPRTSGSTGT